MEQTDTQNANRAPGKIIGVINEKGGVGKSTIAAHFAIWHHERGYKTALLDADGQCSSSRWIEYAEPSLDTYAISEGNEIMEAAAKLKEQYDIIIADGPANLKDSTRALMLVADLVVVPVGVTMLEMEATKDTIRVLDTARGVRPNQEPPAILVLNKTRNKKYNLTKDAIDAAPKLGLPLCDTSLDFADAVGDAPGQRSALWRMGRGAKKSAGQMLKIIEEVTTYGKTNIIGHNEPGTASVSGNGDNGASTDGTEAEQSGEHHAAVGNL